MQGNSKEKEKSVTNIQIQRKNTLLLDARLKVLLAAPSDSLSAPLLLTDSVAEGS